jgi:hypothetical protein
MRFPNPVPRTCTSCGQPTVVAESSIGPLRVHCGTWRWQCDTPATVAHRQPSATPVPLTAAEPEPLAA